MQGLAQSQRSDCQTVTTSLENNTTVEVATPCNKQSMDGGKSNSNIIKTESINGPLRPDWNKNLQNPLRPEPRNVAAAQSTNDLHVHSAAHTKTPKRGVARRLVSSCSSERRRGVLRHWMTVPVVLRLEVPSKVMR